MNKYIRLSIAVFGIVALLLQVLNIYIYNRDALESPNATRIQAKLSALAESNIELESQLLSLSSYNTIASRAGSIGYVENKEFVSLYDPIPLAVRR